MMYSNMNVLSSFAMFFGVFSFFFIIIVIALLILYLVGLWNLFQKAGRKGWEAIIPFYNSWVLVEIAGLTWWYALLIILSSIIHEGNISFILSLGSTVANFFVFYNISKKLHRDTGFAILMTLFPFIMVPFVGLSNSYQFDHSVEVSENGPISQGNRNHSSGKSADDEANVSNGSVSQKHFCPYCGN